MTNYVTELQTRSSAAYIARAAAESKALLAKYGPWIDRYRGGIPAGWAAAIMNWESGGNFNAPGDASLGEVGFYQVSAYVPPLFGLPAEARMDPETNVFLGLMEYQYDVARWKAAYPSIVELASDDAWKLARLSFSIGWGGANTLAKRVTSTATRGHLYDAIKADVAATGGMAAGSQSADQVWFRVLAIDVQWEIGRAAGSMWSTSGPPTRVPNPPGYAYSIPAPYATLFADETNWLALGAIVAAGFALWKVW